MTIRDQIFKSKLDSELVVIPEWGNVKVEVRAKTVEEQYTLLDKVRNKDGDINNKLLAVETIMATTYDPETGEKVFEAADRDHLQKLNAAGFNRLLAAANKAAGLEDSDEVKSDLDDAQKNDSSTG